MHASARFKRIAGIDRAYVVVVAVLHLAGTLPAGTDVVLGALIAVITRPGPGDIQAPLHRIARIRGARIAVIAIHRRSGNADTV